MYQFAPNLFGLGQIFLENQLSHFTCKYVNLRFQTAEMEAPVDDSMKTPCKALSSSLGVYHTQPPSQNQEPSYPEYSLN